MSNEDLSIIAKTHLLREVRKELEDIHPPPLLLHVECRPWFGKRRKAAYDKRERERNERQRRAWNHYDQRFNHLIELKTSLEIELGIDRCE